MIQKNASISAVFIGVDIMTALQTASLEERFGIQVFDRYFLISLNYFLIFLLLKKKN